MSVWVNVLVDGNYAESMAGDRRMEQTLEPQDPTIWLMVGYAYVAGHVLLKTAEGVLRERWGKRDRWELGAWDGKCISLVLERGECIRIFEVFRPARSRTLEVSGCGCKNSWMLEASSLKP